MAGHELDRLRAVKSVAELSIMREAGRIAAAALRAGVDALVPGTSEFDVAAEIVGAMIRGGSGRPPVLRPGGRRATSGLPQRATDLVYLGFGLRYRGYCGRIATGLTVGLPNPAQRRFLEANAEITEACLDIAKPGWMAWTSSWRSVVEAAP